MFSSPNIFKTSPVMTKLQLSASIKEALYSHKRIKDNYTNVRYLVDVVLRM